VREVQRDLVVRVAVDGVHQPVDDAKFFIQYFR
jgi:hypothetical protein